MSQSVTEIPASQVGRVVQDFIDDGTENLVVEKNPNGTYTVSAQEP